MSQFNKSDLGKPTWSSSLVFLTGALAAWKMELVGVLYAGELILFLVAAWAAAVNVANPRFWERAMALPLVCLGITFFGYVLADLINGTESNNLLRGWARIVFLATNIVGIHFLCRKKPLNLLIFSLGVSAGTALMPAGGDMYFHYKLGLALPLTVIVLCLGVLPQNRTAYLLTSAGLAAAGVLHIVMDFRSLGGVCIVCAGIIFWKTTWHTSLRGVYALVVLAVLAAASLMFSDSYHAAQSAYSGRRQESDSRRMAAGAAVLDAIRQAPWLGNGSWATSSRIATMFDASYAETSGRRQAFQGNLELPGHSQFLQVWYEAGVLGLAFFVCFICALARALWICIFRAHLDPLIPLAILYCWLSLYNVAFSPFAGGHRIHMATAVVIAAAVSRNWKSFVRVKDYLSLGILQPAH